MVPMPHRPNSNGGIFLRLVADLKKMISVLSPGRVIKQIIWGENLLVMMRNLLQTLQKVENNLLLDKKKGAPASPEPNSSSQATDANDSSPAPEKESSLNLSYQDSVTDEERANFSFTKELLNIVFS